MQPKLIEVVTKKGYADTIIATAEQMGAVDQQVFDLGDDEHELTRILFFGADRQALIDRLQSVLGAGGGWRIVILPVDATVPRLEPPKDEDNSERARAVVATREEIFEAVAGGASVDSTFLILATLSAMVAGVGLVTNSAAVVIGAMVIAPLLGPSLAFALGTALGDGKLMWRAVLAIAAGLAIVIALAAVASAVMPLPLGSAELAARTRIGYQDIVVGAASGAAAALSLTTQLPTMLVGVMVAVAMLPPAVTAGLMAGAGKLSEALGAGSLLLANIVSVVLAAQVVFVSRGIKPRTWLETKASRQSVALSVSICFVLLAAIAWVIYIHGG